MERGSEVDIDRLHGVLTGKMVGRGCGKTYAICQQIVGLILDESSYQRIAVVVSDMWETPRMKHMLADMLVDNEYTYASEYRDRLTVLCPRQYPELVADIIFFVSRTKNIEVRTLYEISMKTAGIKEVFLINATYFAHPGFIDTVYERKGGQWLAL